MAEGGVPLYRVSVLVFFVLLILSCFYVFYAGLVSTPWQICQPLINSGAVEEAPWVDQSYGEELVDPRKLPEAPTPWLRNIFFVETSCALLGFPNTALDSNETAATEAPAPWGGLRMSARVACSIEAAARLNPQRPVYFLHTCPINATAMWESAPPYALEVLELANVRVWDARLAALLARSPLKGLLGRGKLSASKWPKPHASDVLRVLLLTEFGGTYLDTDVVLLRPLGEMRNFSPLEMPDSLNNAVMDLAWDNTGRQVGEDCIKEMAQYSPTNWAYNGPALITRVMRRRCGLSRRKNFSPGVCDGFNVLPESSFYPIDYHHWISFYKEKDASQVMKKINGSYGVHIWSHFDVNAVHKVSLSSMQPYAQIARAVCPRVVASGKDEM